MKCSLDQIVDKLQLLVNRMREHENAVDKVTTEVIKLETRMSNQNVSKEASLSITDFSKRLSMHPRGQLILCLAAENKELEELRSENCTLLSSLMEHQAALDIIMSKYRGQISKLMRTNEVEDMIRNSFSSLTSLKNHSTDASEAPRFTDNLTTVANGVVTAQPVDGLERLTGRSMNPAIRRLIASTSATNPRLVNEKLATLAALALDISDQGDAYATELEGELHRLRSENAGLREMLAISSSFSNEVGITRPEDRKSSSSSTEASATNRTGAPPGPPHRPTNSDPDNWPFENPTDRSGGVSHFLNALKAHPFFPEEFVSSPEEDDDEEDAMTVGENNEELEVDIGRDTHMPKYSSE
ncbi:putative Cleavage and polyadenylation specificity factor [Fasciola hepatica]|uniref:Cleavage and polyadenylation specificity factor n=1 Tax=Fasciola hepatica TaxID=6192 RepID=A0A2H1CA36_FASHE|nr:putative Cleavage and polyadenylation specificity factor [Fasciola hepatica]